MRIIRPTGEVLLEYRDDPDSLTVREVKADLVDITGASVKNLKVNLREYLIFVKKLNYL